MKIKKRYHDQDLCNVITGYTIEEEDRHYIIYYRNYFGGDYVEMGTLPNEVELTESSIMKFARSVVNFNHPDKKHKFFGLF